MTKPELKPCPFCGANQAYTYYVRDGRVAMCPACGASSGSQFNGPADLPSANDRAIAAWNTRTDAHPVTLEMMKRFADMFDACGCIDEEAECRAAITKMGDLK